MGCCVPCCSSHADADGTRLAPCTALRRSGAGAGAVPASADARASARGGAARVAGAEETRPPGVQPAVRERASARSSRCMRNHESHSASRLSGALGFCPGTSVMKEAGLFARHPPWRVPSASAPHASGSSAPAGFHPEPSSARAEAGRRCEPRMVCCTYGETQAGRLELWFSLWGGGIRVEDSQRVPTASDMLDVHLLQYVPYAVTASQVAKGATAHSWPNPAWSAVTAPSVFRPVMRVQALNGRGLLVHRRKSLARPRRLRLQPQPRPRAQLTPPLRT
jgi:hypothetical protein